MEDLDKRLQILLAEAREDCKDALKALGWWAITLLFWVAIAGEFYLLWIIISQ